MTNGIQALSLANSSIGSGEYDNKSALMYGKRSPEFVLFLIICSYSARLFQRRVANFLRSS